MHSKSSGFAYKIAASLLLVSLFAFGIPTHTSASQVIYVRPVVLFVVRHEYTVGVGQVRGSESRTAVGARVRSVTR